MKRPLPGAGLAAAVWALSAASALASFTNLIETPYDAGTLHFYGSTNIKSSGTYNNSGALVYSNSTLPADTGPMYQVCNSGTAGYDYYYGVGEMVQNGGGTVTVNNNSGGTMQGYVTGSGQAFAAGFWGENNTFSINNSGVMDGEVWNNDGSAVGLYVNAAAENITNNAGATCSATAAYSAFGILAEGSGVANVINRGTITATASGGTQGTNVGSAYAVAVGLGTCCGGNYPNNFENDGTVKAIVTATDATNVNCRAFNCWAGCGPAILRNTGLLYTRDASGGDFEIYEGSDGYDDYLYNSGTITNASNGEAVILENDSNTGDIHFDNSGTIAAPNCAYCIVIWGFPVPTPGAGHIWFTNSGTFIGGQVNTWWDTTVWNSGDVRAGSFNFGGGSEVHIMGLPVINPTINGGGTSADTLSFNLLGTLQKINGQAASGTNLSAFNLGSSGSIVVSGQTYNWGGFNRVSGTVSAAGGVPPVWASQDVGSVSAAGGAVYGGGLLTMLACGSGLGSTADAFHFVSQPVAGNGSIIARVSAEQGANGGAAKAGVMIRDSLNAGAANAFVGVVPGNSVVWQYRSGDGGGCSSNKVTGLSASYWVKLTQSGSAFTGSYSVDGVSWIQLGSTTITTGATNYLGLAYGNNSASSGTVTFDSVTITGGLNPPTTPAGLTATAGIEQAALNWQAAGNAAGYNIGRATVSGGPYATVGSASGTNYTDTGLAGGTTYYYVVTAVTLGSQSGNSAQVSATPAANVPPPWLALDIGAVGLAGNESCSNGVFTVIGGGADIWNTADACHFVYLPVTNNCTVIARVTSVPAIDPWSKAGVMMRASLSSNAVNAFIAVTPSNGVSFQSRSSNGGQTGNDDTSAPTAPYWVRLARSGSTFTGYGSPDGTNWTLVGTATLTMPVTVYAGLAVTAHNNSSLCAATFDNVSAPGWLPTPPLGLVATAASPNQINLVWDAYTNGATYNVARSTTSGGPYAVIAAGVTATNYNDTGLTLGATYYYVVNAVVSGAQTPDSAEASAATPSPFVYSWGSPVSIAGLTAGQILTNFPGTEIVGAMLAQNGGGSITVTPGDGASIVFAPANTSWASLAGGNGYTTGASTNLTGNASFNSCLNAFYYDGGPHVITLSGLVVGQQYSVQLFALDDRSLNPAGSARTVNWQNPADAINVSPTYSMAANAYVVLTFMASNAVQEIQENLLNSGAGNFNCLVLRAVAPGAPAGLTATAVSTSQINLAWNGATNAATYTVQRSTTNGGPYAILATGVTATNYTDTHLTSGTTYYYLVSAVNPVGQSADSAPVGATTLSQPRVAGISLVGGSLVFSGTNGSVGGAYTLWSATNLATPLTNWLPAGSGVFDGKGNFRITNAINPNQPQQFFLLRQP
jgi:fibronectin type 3 domain-containing protein